MIFRPSISKQILAQRFYEPRNEGLHFGTLNHDESLEKETPAGHTILTYILTWCHVNSLGV